MDIFVIWKTVVRKITYHPLMSQHQPNGQEQMEQIPFGRPKGV
jgi:hypothetical protein